MNRTTLLVTSNTDSGPGSLRAALEQTQRTPGNYDIVFSGSSRGTNNLGTGFYTIQLSSALPNLYRSDIRINVVTARSVTIPPAAAGAGPNALRPKSLTNRAADGASPSLLTVGDVNKPYNPRYTISGPADGPGLKSITSVLSAIAPRVAMEIGQQVAAWGRVEPSPFWKEH